MSTSIIYQTNLSPSFGNYWGAKAYPPSLATALMQVSILSIMVYPQDLHQEFAPTLGLLHPNFCQGGKDFVGAAPEGQALVCT